MRVSCMVVCAVALLVLTLEAKEVAFAEPVTPQVPETSIATNDAHLEPAVASEVIPAPQEIVKALTQGNDYPERLIIPSIKLDVAVQDVGVNAKGEMDVPGGNTNNVGWYEGGTIPGNVGTAVMDAHVYAAFKNLRYVKVGAEIYVKTKSGKTLHYRAADSRVYKTQEVPLDKLFNQHDAARLNLITCAGKYLPKLETYDRRLIVYAVLVNE